MSTSRWLRTFGVADNGDLPRLIIFPHAGGAASFYHRLHAMLSSSMSVLVVQYPGRQDRRNEVPLRSVSEIVDGIEAEVLTLDPRPTIFLGHSMGAVVAYELGLRSSIRNIVKLAGFIASGRRAPSVVRDEAVHLMELPRLLGEISRLGGGDYSKIFADRDLMPSVVRALRADYEAIEKYRSSEDCFLECPISVAIGSSDPRVSEEDAGAWTAHTSNTVRICQFDGGHFYFASNLEAFASFVSRQSHFFLSLVDDGA